MRRLLSAIDLWITSLRIYSFVDELVKQAANGQGPLNDADEPMFWMDWAMGQAERHDPLCETVRPFRVKVLRSYQRELGPA